MIRAAAIALPAAALLSACASMTTPMATFDPSTLPAGVQAPSGHRVALETTGVGQITYECRAKSAAAGEFEWAFVGPDARLMDRHGRTVGRYWGPPATWENVDGSKLTGAQVAVAPAAAGSIPLQLVKANPATGSGTLGGVSYIQRVATRGGVAPAMPCAAPQAGAREVVQYQADYIFYKPR